MLKRRYDGSAVAPASRLIIFRRSFARVQGLPLKVYINELRVEAAKWLLLEAGENTETVAARIGLHDTSHLSKLFVRYAGVRPGAYRRVASQDTVDSPRATSAQKNRPQNPS